MPHSVDSTKSADLCTVFGDIFIHLCWHIGACVPVYLWKPNGIIFPLCAATNFHRGCSTAHSVCCRKSQIHFSILSFLFFSPVCLFHTKVLGGPANTACLLDPFFLSPLPSIFFKFFYFLLIRWMELAGGHSGEFKLFICALRFKSFRGPRKGWRGQSKLKREKKGWREGGTCLF